MLLRVSQLLFLSLLFFSCSDSGLKKDFDEAEKLALEAAASRDSLQDKVDFLSNELERTNKALKVWQDAGRLTIDENISLTKENESLRKIIFSNKKEKPKASVSVGVVSAKKENTEVSRADTSITVTVSDSLDTDNTKEPVKPMSFIEYVWSKRNKVEP